MAGMPRGDSHASSTSQRAAPSERQAMMLPFVGR